MVLAGFEEGKQKGLAIAGKLGDPVLAAADGRVVYAGSGLRGYGNLVIVKHNNTYLTAYAHNQSLLVKEDQAVEHDPLEALKLGTYVGSCIGLGGQLSDSAAAVVLDANKHVAYARDARGAVIGRQLVAISEQDKLVCFWVYGTVERAVLEPLFLAFDQAFSRALGLPLYGHPHDPSDAYAIASILSHEWWDDTAWTAEPGDEPAKSERAKSDRAVAD